MAERGPRQATRSDATEAEGATTLDRGPPGTPDSLGGTAWRLVTSPTTLLVIGALLGVYLTWAAFVPASLSQTELATSMGFGAAEITVGLGASDPIAAWPFWLLCLFAALHLVARLLAPREPHAGLAVAVTVAAATTPDALVARLGRLAPRKAFFRAADGNTLILRQGAPAEAAVALALGLIAVAMSFVLNKDHALDAELAVTTGDVSSATTRSTVNIDGNIIERSLPFRLVCSAPDPLDTAYTIGCLFAGPNALNTPGAEVILRPGTTTEVDGYRLTPLRASPVAAGAEAPLSLLWQAGETPVRVVVPPGQTIAVADDAKTSFSGGAVGGLPWLLSVDNTDGAAPKTTLILPAALDAPASELSLLNTERLTVRVQNVPPRWLFWLGIALVLLGLAIWIAVPSLTFTARLATLAGEPPVTRVTISSINRPGRLAAWVAAVADEPREPNA